MEKSADIQKAIVQSPWFKDLPQDAINELVLAAKTTAYEHQTYLYRLGEQSHFIYCVLSGAVRIKINSLLGQEFAITDFNEGSWLGEGALTEKSAKMFEAQILNYSVVLQIPAKKVIELAKQHPIIYRNLFLAENDHTVHMTELLGGMLFYPLRARLAGRLLWLLKENGVDQEDGILIDKKISQQEFASFTMGSRQRINGILREWQELNIISMSDQRYLIKNKAALYDELAPLADE
jgi:CRP-like cAMP-binding protein